KARVAEQVTGADRCACPLADDVRECNRLERVDTVCDRAAVCIDLLFVDAEPQCKKFSQPGQHRTRFMKTDERRLRRFFGGRFGGAPFSKRLQIASRKRVAAPASLNLSARSLEDRPRLQKTNRVNLQLVV